jgi:hypothetical protein
MMNGRELYLNPRQSTTREPSAWENELGDAIEAAFSEGCYELDALVRRLNLSRVRPREGGMWTAETFVATMRELGA